MLFPVAEKPASPAALLCVQSMFPGVVLQAVFLVCPSHTTGLSLIISLGMPTVCLHAEARHQCRGSLLIAIHSVFQTGPVTELEVHAQRWACKHSLAHLAPF